jgi:O-antigen/teichoic acid export membrane protein
VNVVEETKTYSLLKQGTGTKFLITFGITIVLAKALSIAFTKIFTNILPDEEMGQYAIFVTASMTILAYASIGFQNALSRYTVTYKIKGKKENLKNLVFSGFTSFLVIESVIIGIFIILYYVRDFYPSFLEIEPYIVTLLAVGVIALAQFFSTMCYNIASSLQNSRYYAVPVIMRVLLQIPLGILFVVVLDQGLLGLIVGVSLAELIVAIYCGFVLIKDLGIGKFSFKELKSALTYSTPVYGMTMLLRTFNLYLLVYFEQVFTEGGEAMIAYYSFGALPVANILVMVGQMFRTVYRPIVFRYFEKDQHEQLENLTKRILKLYGVIILAICLLLFAFSPVLITYLFSKSTYLAGMFLIPLMFLARIFEQLTNITSYGHTLFYKNYWVMVAGVISIGLGVLVAYFAIPIIGLLAIGIVYVTIKLIHFIILLTVSQHYFKIQHDYRSILKILVAAIISIGIGIIFNLYVIPGGIYTVTSVSYLISTILYVGLVFLFRLIKRDDYNFVKNLVKSFIETRTTSA